jgi:hypothetical protein
MAAVASSSKSTFDVAFFACLLGVAAQIALAATIVVRPGLLTVIEAVSIFGAACFVPFVACWRAAILDGRLPALPVGTPKHDHITGWGFLALACIVGVIVGLATWATSSEIADKRIHADWGVGVVFGLAIAFVFAALTPVIANALAPAQARRLFAFVRPLGWVARPFGTVLSGIDSIMVFAVAGSAGAAQKWLLLRYFLLFGVIIPCAVLGYFLPAPYGLIPIAWGFVVAISMSRRWSWIEDDRELYMLNRKFSGSHLRIGFSQDLRDEALLSFMSMFFLVPLALQQFQAWTSDTATPLFHTTPGASLSLLDWIGYYGTELAKAVPFVDWAEIYQVEGVAPIEARTPMARHAVFATRVLVDLVFLAALLQALSISARNAKQMDLFWAGTLDRLDPFVEPREFRKLLRRTGDGAWEINEDALAKFPKYDGLRLAELSDPSHKPIDLVARALRRRDGSDDEARFYEQLEERAFAKKKDADAIDEVLTALRMSSTHTQVDELDHVRIELNHKRAMNGVRETIVRMIRAAPNTTERIVALESALIGKTNVPGAGPAGHVRDAVAPVRRIALEAFEELALLGDANAIRVIDIVASNDPSGNIQKMAAAILARIRARGA